MGHFRQSTGRTQSGEPSLFVLPPKINFALLVWPEERCNVDQSSILSLCLPQFSNLKMAAEALDPQINDSYTRSVEQS